ncbi:hypothetical protein AgCh_009437 [Apium graveolens]
MPGLKSGDIKLQVNEDNMLVVCGERHREEEKEGVKYVKLERRIDKFMRKFVLPENANLEKIKAVCQDGVLSVTAGENLATMSDGANKLLMSDFKMFYYVKFGRKRETDGDMSSGFFGFVEVSSSSRGFYRNHMEEVIRFFETHHKRNRMDLRVRGYDPLLNTFYHILDDDNHSANDNKSSHACTYVRDAKAMTPADVK